MKFITLVFLIFFHSACGQTSPLHRTTLTINTHHLHVEIAKSQKELEKGLMNREELADDEGMLFVYPTTRLITLWMKNTPLSLDMIFLGEHKQIIHIHHSAHPYSLEKISSGTPARYAIEIKGGLAKNLGFKVGDQVSFSDI